MNTLPYANATADPLTVWQSMAIALLIIYIGCAIGRDRQLSAQGHTKINT